MSEYSAKCNSMTQAEIELLKSYLAYDANNGALTWKINRYRNKAGDVVSTVSNSGYLVVEINRRKYQAHRLIWAIYYGHFPRGQIDHINRIRTDNRIENLRDVLGNENHLNCGLRKDNTSGFKGVSYAKRENKWRAYLRVNGKLKHLGFFETPELANAAYKNAFNEIYPNFA